MRMTYDEFLNITPRQFSNAVEGFIELQSGKSKDRWKQTSVILAYIANKPVQGYKIQTKTPQQILPFAWDENGDLPTQDDLEKLRQETWPQEQ